MCIECSSKNKSKLNLRTIELLYYFAHMKGFSFTSFRGDKHASPFERLLKIFSELIIYTSGDVDEALSWMRELDKEYKLSDSSYTIDDFERDLKKKGYVLKDESNGPLKPGPAMERLVRNSAMEEIFGKLRNAGRGSHRLKGNGDGDELSEGIRQYQFGDLPGGILLDESIKNALQRPGSSEFHLRSDDLMVREMDKKVGVSTVLLIDISHSMILYGEDRITPAKKVALALGELITRKYTGDSLDIVVFGDDAKPVQLKDLLYLQVGPYHTNTVAGLQMARDILRKKHQPNKQIIMITDGKPSCIKIGAEYYKNSFGLDRLIVNRTLNEASACRRAGIHITTFMIARDQYLQQFISEFTHSCQGKAYYAGLEGLGKFVFEDFERNRKKWIG